MEHVTRYDLNEFDEVAVDGRGGFVVTPRYQSHIAADDRFIEFGCVVVKFFGDGENYIFEAKDVVVVD